MNFYAFPKVFAIGKDEIKDLFVGPVEVTEKVDGSQFAFGRIDGETVMRSKGQKLYPESAEKQFQPAVEYAATIAPTLPDNTVLYCEYLQTPRHNVLKYDRVPKNNLVCFGVLADGHYLDLHSDIHAVADGAGVETVALLHVGEIRSAEELRALLERESVLGGTTVEGVVVKNYAQRFLLGGIAIPLMAGKFVSEKFKETHKAGWDKEHTARGKWDAFMDGFRTEARWQKAVQHLRDAGELENDPRDIGKLLKAVHLDIEEEDKEQIKEFLWKEFGAALKRRATGGLPEWYKGQLLARAFAPEE